jgi:high-affinity nickel-transport protein
MPDLGLFLSAAGLGFILGMRHATDADHVVAITTIVSRQRSFAAAGAVGALWGLGHTLTVTLVGLLIIVFGLVISPPVGLTLELLVGFMLVLLGVLTLTGTMGRLVERFGLPHEHPHAHDGGAHTHAHDLAHELEDLDRESAGPGLPRQREGGRGDAVVYPGVFARLGTFNIVRPITIGLVHGLAGSAAIALLVLASVPNPTSQLVFLAIFNVGVISGMILITSVLGLPFVFASARFERLHRALVLASGTVSLALGLVLIYQIGIVDGLFTGNPHWTPG